MEYSIEFGERLIEATGIFFAKDPPENEAGRAVLYLSLLSCEITLKALLEKAGFEVPELIKRSHNLRGLIEDICCCELADATNNNSVATPASSLLSEQVINNFWNGTVGALLQGASKRASKYPSEIRYGELVAHFSPRVMRDCALVVSRWAKENINSIRRKMETPCSN